MSANLIKQCMMLVCLCVYVLLWRNIHLCTFIHNTMVACKGQRETEKNLTSKSIQAI